MTALPCHLVSECLFVVRSCRRLKKNREAAQASRDRRVREFRELNEKIERLTNEKRGLVEEAERLRYGTVVVSDFQMS